MQLRQHCSAWDCGSGVDYVIDRLAAWLQVLSAAHHILCRPLGQEEELLLQLRQHCSARGCGAGVDYVIACLAPCLQVLSTAHHILRGPLGQEEEVLPQLRQYRASGDCGHVDAFCDHCLLPLCDQQASQPLELHGKHMRIKVLLPNGNSCFKRGLVSKSQFSASARPASFLTS